MLLCFALQVVRTLVTPGNPAQVTLSSQKTMKACGLLETLCEILMASGVPADILTETINTVAEVIRGNQGNQEYFANVMAPSNPPRYITSLKVLHDPIKPLFVSGPVGFTMGIPGCFLLYVICINQNTGIFRDVAVRTPNSKSGILLKFTGLGLEVLNFCMPNGCLGQVLVLEM